jgi:hypothetical protein
METQGNGGVAHLRREVEAEAERIKRTTADLIAAAAVLTILPKAKRGRIEGRDGGIACGCCAPPRGRVGAVEGPEGVQGLVAARRFWWKRR